MLRADRQTDRLTAIKKRTFDYRNVANPSTKTVDTINAFL